MRFSFILANHSALGQQTLFDIVDALGSQLTDLGHTVTLRDKNLVLDEINILIEAFDFATADNYRRAAEHGCRFIVIMTERPGKPGFNDSNVAGMIERQKAFPLVAKHAIAVWCLVPGAAPWVRRFHPNVSDLELGWSDHRYKTVFNPSPPMLDFCYYGSMTPRRQNMINQIERRGYKVLHNSHADKFQTPRERNQMVNACRVVLGIDPFPKWKLVSNSRLATALSCGRPVIAEPPRGPTGWDKVGVFAKRRSSYVDEAIAMLQNWEEVRDQQIALAKYWLGPDKVTGPVLELTRIAEFPEVKERETAE